MFSGGKTVPEIASVICKITGKGMLRRYKTGAVVSMP